MKTWIPLLVLAVAPGCASLPAADEPDPEDGMAQGIAALERQDFPLAYDHFRRVYERNWTSPVGQQALLALAAVELDPRNAGRRLDVGAELAARHFQLPGAQTWNMPVSQTLYLLAHELGAAEARAMRAEAEKEHAERELARSEQERLQAETEARQARVQAQRAASDAAGARREARQAEARASQARRPLPELGRPSVTARVRELREERDRLAGEVRELRAELAKREQELKRIRETLAERG